MGIPNREIPIGNSQLGISIWELAIGDLSGPPTPLKKDSGKQQQPTDDTDDTNDTDDTGDLLLLLLSIFIIYP